MSNKKKKNTKKKKQSKSVKINPSLGIQYQFIGIHNQSLKNSMRDSKVRESIRVRLKEDDTLSEAQITDLEKRRKELLP